MARKKRDDLFDNSSMSFGEHLTELRYRLIQSIYWLVGGFVLALIPWGSFGSLSGWAVGYIQRPLTAALEDFYVSRSSEKIQNQIGYLEEIGYSKEIALIPQKMGMAEREIWLFPDDIDRLRRLLTGSADGSGQEARRRRAESQPLFSDEQILRMVDNFDRYKTKDLSAETPRSAPSEFDAASSDVSDRMKPIPFLVWEKLENDPRVRAKSLSMPETFIIFLKAAVVLGIFIASPAILYHFWAFVGAGLYSSEKKYIYRFLPVSVLLFFTGAALAFFVVFQFVLSYLLTFNAGMNIDPDPRISEWLKMAIGLPIGFGIGFQLPLVMFALYRMRIFTVGMYWDQWRISILVIAFCSMMLTPPDPGSMFCMLVPLVSLYFLGIGLCKLWPLPKSDFDEWDEKDEEDDD